MSGEPEVHRIVLVGGGHTHVQVMRAFGAMPQPGVSLTLVSDRIDTPYSGMLPGHVAGFYDRAAMHIDLQRLAEACGVAFVHMQAVSLDRGRRRLALADGGGLAYDTLSLNVGIAPDLSSVAGAAEHAIAVKPISSFLERLDALTAGGAPSRAARRLVVVGGRGGRRRDRAGAEGPFRTRRRGVRPVDRLVAGGGLLPTLNGRVRAHAAAALVRNGVEIIEGFRAAEATAEG